MVEDGVFSHKIDYVTVLLEILISKGIQIALLVNSYGNFAEWVDFANWLSFSGGGSAINGDTPSSYF